MSKPSIIDEDGCRVLYVFTMRYPFGTGEVFFEAELPYLVERFERVVIQPILGDAKRRVVPAGVEVCAPLYELGNKARRLQSAAFSLRACTEIVSEIIRSLNAPRFDFWRIVSWGLHKRLLENSEGLRRALSGGARSRVYAYWGNVPALVTASCKRGGVPVAVRFHRVDLYEHGGHNNTGATGRVQAFPWRHQVQGADRLLFISEDGYRYFKEKWTTVDFDQKAMISRLGTLDHGESQVQPHISDDFVIVSCSRVAPVKRVHLVGQFAAALSRRYNVVWHHFGSGQSDELSMFLRSGELYPNLQTVQHGWVPNSELISFYRRNRVDLFVNLSSSEGIPVSIMEAISFDIPVLATDVDGTAEAVVEGRSGFLCTSDEAKNAEVLVYKIQPLLERKFTDTGKFVQLEPRSIWKERFDANKNYPILANDLYFLR